MLHDRNGILVFDAALAAPSMSIYGTTRIREIAALLYFAFSDADHLGGAINLLFVTRVSR